MVSYHRGRGMNPGGLPQWKIKLTKCKNVVVLKKTLHEEYQLPRLSGTSLKVCGVEMRWRRGQTNVHTNTLIIPGRLKLS
jgi:hypothetical protein